MAWVLLWVLADKPRRKQLFRDALLGFGGLLVLYLPWVPTTLYQAAHTGAPWADAPAFDSLLGVPGVLLGRMPQIVLLICAGAGLLVLVKRPLSERGKAALCLAIIAVLTPTIAWLLSQASPAWANRYLAVALPPFLLLAAGGLASARRLGLVGLVLVVIMWAQDAAPVEKSNVRAIAHSITPSLQPGDLVISTQPESIPVLHYYLPRRAEVRDADRRADRARRVGLARRRRAPGGDDAREGPQARDRRAAGRRARRAGRADHVDAQPLARAVDGARPDPLEGVVAVPLERSAAEGRRDSADELHAAAAESGAGDGDGEDALAGSVSTKQAPRS